jgi:hypothetical protein
MSSTEVAKKSATIKIKVTKVVKLKNGCRKRHVSIHNPNLEIYYCENCKANVTATEKLVCNCCGKEVPKMVKNNFARLEKVLNKAQREYGQLAEDWSTFPTKKPVTLEIGLGSQVYKIDIKYVALWNEAIPKEDKLKVISKFNKLYGLRIWIPDDDMD